MQVPTNFVVQLAIYLLVQAVTSEQVDFVYLSSSFAEDSKNLVEIVFVDLMNSLVPVLN